MKAAALLVLVAACASFEDPTMIRDLRVIAVQAIPPERVIDIDPENLPPPDEILPQLGRTNVYAVIADPGTRRRVLWSMSLCILGEDGRCSPDHPELPVASGAIEDPEGDLRSAACPFNPLGERDMPAGVICVEVDYDEQFLAMMMGLLRDDPVRGLGGLDYGLSLRVGGADADPSEDVFASKLLRISLRIPEDKKQNQNPRLDNVLIGSGGIGRDLPFDHCGAEAHVDRPVVAAGTQWTLYPIEPEGTREKFVVPTLDGQFEMFEETISYQWLATAGGFTDAITGGPPDIFGNERLLGTEWVAPRVGGQVNVSVWVVQRDERYGVTWWESCITVNP